MRKAKPKEQDIEPEKILIIIVVVVFYCCHPFSFLPLFWGWEGRRRPWGRSVRFDIACPVLAGEALGAPGLIAAPATHPRFFPANTIRQLQTVKSSSFKSIQLGPR